MKIKHFFWTSLGIFSAWIVKGFYEGAKLYRRKLVFGEKQSDESLRILHISDTHLCSSTLKRLEALEFAVDGKWDLVFVTGDLIENDSGIKPITEALSKLDATYGKYAVFGNHDYFGYTCSNPYEWAINILGCFRKQTGDKYGHENDIGALKEHLENDAGVKVLINETIEIETSFGRSIQIFGIDDPSKKRDKAELLYDKVNPEALRIVIMHSPHNLKSIKPLRPEIILCGHTHGGQVRLPFIGPVTSASDAPRDKSAGTVELEGMRVHVSFGLGAGKLFPFRFNSPREITEILLPINSRISDSEYYEGEQSVLNT